MANIEYTERVSLLVNIDCLDEDLQDIAHEAPHALTNTLLLQLIRDVQRLTQTLAR
jgi:hypothetical protein